MLRLDVEKHTRFVCAGAEHIDRLSMAIEALGFQQKYAHGITDYTVLKENGIFGKSTVQVKDLDYIAIDLQKVFDDIR